MNDCPIEGYKSQIENEHSLFGIIASQYDEQIKEEIALAFDFALSSQKPSSADAEGKVYA